MKYSVTGADKETGNDVAISLAADSQLEAMQMASQRGIMIATIEPIAEVDAAAPRPTTAPHQNHLAPAHTNHGHADGPHADAHKPDANKMENHKTATDIHAPSAAYLPVNPHASNHASAAPVPPGSRPPAHPAVVIASTSPTAPAAPPIAAHNTDQPATAAPPTPPVSPTPPGTQQVTPAAASISSAPAHEAHHFQPGQIEYKLMVNQALYLLESAVNKYLKEGWEPTGGLTVGVSNNALQFYQALIRRH